MNQIVLKRSTCGWTCGVIAEGRAKRRKKRLWPGFSGISTSPMRAIDCTKLQFHLSRTSWDLSWLSRLCPNALSSPHPPLNSVTLTLVACIFDFFNTWCLDSFHFPFYTRVHPSDFGFSFPLYNPSSQFDGLPFSVGPSCI